MYTLNPAFRAEASHTRNHLAEFYMLEAESVRLDSVDSLCEEIESLTRILVTSFLDRFSSKSNNCSDDGNEDPLPSAESVGGWHYTFLSDFPALQMYKTRFDHAINVNVIEFRDFQCMYVLCFVCL